MLASGSDPLLKKKKKKNQTFTERPLQKKDEQKFYNKQGKKELLWSVFCWGVGVWISGGLF